MDWRSISPSLATILKTHRFDEKLFDRLVVDLVAGRMGPSTNRLVGDVQAPETTAWTSLPAMGEAEHEALVTLGQEAIRRGKVGVVILNGGMATRFGGVVKCAVEVLDGRTFLDLKTAEVRSSGREGVPIFLMNSFATDAVTRRLSEHIELEGAVHHFTQSEMVRVTPEGAVYLDGEGHASPYAPGHGDLVDAIRSADLLETFRESGGELLVMSNVDNLGATLDPAIIGAHLRGGGEMTVEVVAKHPGDKGGAPAIVDDVLQIVEDFRFPENFDQDLIPVFNTNTFVFSAAALQRDFSLTWFAVRKVVDGVPVIQFERLAGELTSFLDARYLLVPREGRGGRFLPVKDPSELERRQSTIREVLVERGVLR